MTYLSLTCDRMPASNLSLWLLPKQSSPENEALSGVIQNLATKYQKYPHLPHVTLSILPEKFPLVVVNSVLEEMKGELFKETVEFETLFTSRGAIMVHGKHDNHLAELQKKWHTRLAEELQRCVDNGELNEEELRQEGVSMDVKNVVPWFPHLSIAYTNTGHQEGIDELEAKGSYKPSPPIELGGYTGYKIGAIFAAYCGGLKAEKWKIFMRLEDESY